MCNRMVTSPRCSPRSPYCGSPWPLSLPTRSRFTPPGIAPMSGIGSGLAEAVPPIGSRSIDFLADVATLATAMPSTAVVLTTSTAAMIPTIPEHCRNGLRDLLSTVLNDHQGCPLPTDSSTRARPSSCTLPVTSVAASFTSRGACPIATARPAPGPVEHVDVVAAVADREEAVARNAEPLTHALEAGRLVDAVWSDVEPRRPADGVADLVQAHPLDDRQELLDPVVGRDHDDAGREHTAAAPRTRPGARSPRAPHREHARCTEQARQRPRPRSRVGRWRRMRLEHLVRVEGLDERATVAEAPRVALHHERTVGAHHELGARPRRSSTGSVVEAERPVASVTSWPSSWTRVTSSTAALSVPSSWSTVPSTSRAMSQRRRSATRVHQRPVRASRGRRGRGAAPRAPARTVGLLVRLEQRDDPACRRERAVQGGDGCRLARSVR